MAIAIPSAVLVIPPLVLLRRERRVDAELRRAANELGAVPIGWTWGSPPAYIVMVPDAQGGADPVLMSVEGEYPRALWLHWRSSTWSGARAFIGAGRQRRALGNQ